MSDRPAEGSAPAAPPGDEVTRAARAVALGLILGLVLRAVARR